MLVPRCRAVTNGRKQLLPPQAVSVAISAQPSRPVRITVWPRLLIGNSSVTPCSSARIIACQILRFIDPSPLETSVIHPRKERGAPSTLLSSTITNVILLFQLFEFLICFREDGMTTFLREKVVK